MLLHFFGTCWQEARGRLCLPLENEGLRSVCVSLMTDNSSFEFGSLFVSDYTFVCLFGCVCV